MASLIIFIKSSGKMLRIDCENPRLAENPLKGQKIFPRLIHPEA
jgi:hypothetical protein